MKRILVLGIAAVLGLGIGAPAYADHGGYDYREGDCENGGCGEREETYGDNSCKYVCPDFKDSPVHDAFNFSPQVCLPGATCHFEDRQDRDGGNQGQQPASSQLPPPGCIIAFPFHCDPEPHAAS